MQFRWMLAALFACSATVAQAGLMIESVSGDPSTGVFEKLDPPKSDLSVLSLSNGRGDIKFWYDDPETDIDDPLVHLDKDDERLHGDASWWDSENYSIYTTDVPSRSNHIWIDLSGVKAYGFSFQFAANMSAYGNFDVYHSGLENPLVSFTAHYDAPEGTTIYCDYEGPLKPISRDKIMITRDHSPGFRVSNSGGSCQTIDKIHIDPSPFIWGVFNMGIDTTGGQCASVPEPGSIALLSLGLVGLGLVRINQKRLKETRNT